jgi:hypothetical protein
MIPNKCCKFEYTPAHFRERRREMTRLVFRSYVCGNNELLRNVKEIGKKVVYGVAQVSMLFFPEFGRGRRRFSGLCRETIRMVE